MFFLIEHFFLFLQIFFICLILIASGFLFKKIIFKQHDIKNLEENALFGFILIGFFALLINFFFALNIFVNNIFLLLLIYMTFKYDFFIQNIERLFKNLIYISFFTYILFVYTNVNTPDASLYHLPYSKLINEHKIVIGASNLHYRFGHISIFQYISSFFNNSLFGLNGVLLPLALLPSIFLLYSFKLFKNDFKNDSSRIKSYFIFLILIFSFYSFNRYSGYGNDMPAHLFYFLVVIYLLDFFIIKKTLLTFKKITVICLFIFLIKPFYIISLLLPVLIFFMIRKQYVIFRSRFFIFTFFLFFLWILKTFLTTGCFIYPLKHSCFKKVVWFDSNVKNISLEGEAWSKAWPQNSNKNLSQQEFIKNFNWINAWSTIHLKFIFEKLSPIITFFILNFLFFYFTNCLKKNYQSSYNQFYILFFFTSLLFVFIWFLKIPAYRHGQSFIYIFLLFFCYFVFIKNINFKKVKQFYNIFLFCLILSLVSVVFKNLSRISNNYTQSISPLTYDDYNNYDSVKVYNKDNIFTHYKRNNGNTCGFSISPCTHLGANVKKKSFFGYLIYSKF